MAITDRVIDAIARLEPGSVVVFVNASTEAKNARQRNKDIYVYEIADSLFANNLSHNLMEKHLGKVPVSLPKSHFQIDVLVFGLNTKHSSIQQLREFVHIGGLVVYPDGSSERYFPSPIWDIPFSKTRAGDKLLLARKISQLAEGSIYVEIGSYKGGSAVLAAVSNPKIKIYAVDIWEEIRNGSYRADFAAWKRHTQFFNNIVPISVKFDNLQLGPVLIA